MPRLAFPTNIIGLDGVAESGAKLYSRLRNTSTNTPLYLAASGSETFTNPAITDSVGQITAYLESDTIQYSLEAKTANDAVTLWTADVVSGIVSYTYLNDGLIQQFDASATGNGSTTAYTIEDVQLTSSYQIVASIDGILQPTTAYSVANDGTDSTVTFTSAPPNGSAIYLRSMAAQGLQGARGEQDRTSLSEFATEAVPLVGDGTTTNNVAIAAAEASTVKQIGVPEGTYRTTGVATGAALTKNYFGPGQIETNDGNALIPSWRVISSTPAEGNHNYILTAGNGDAQQVQGFVGTWITGAATLTQPSTGYKVIYETAGRLSHFFVAADAGWNESTTSNDGRTGYFNNVTIGTQAGNGDAGGYFTSIFVTGVRSAGGGGPGVPTDALAMPAGAVHAGQVQAGVNDVYLNNIEMNATDNGYRASAGVFVANLSRDNSDTTNNQFWFAFVASSVGTQDADVAFRVGGRWKLGLDLTAATLNGNQAGIVLKQDQRIFFTGTAGPRYCTAPGSAYMLGSSVGIDMHYNSAVALRVTAQVNPVTYLQVQGTATGVPLSLTTQSTDTNAGVDLQPKGTGSLRLLSGGGTAQVQANNTGLGFFATAPIAKPTVTGSKGANAALTSLLTALANLGLITDSSS